MNNELLYKPKEISNDEMKARLFGVGMINKEKRYKKLFIEDIPVMITDSGKILCIPKSDEVKHIGCSGMTGTLKSLFMNALLGWDYWHMKRDCINLNDFQKETFEWSVPTESFLHMMSIIHAKPTPLPIIYVFPSTKTLQIERKDMRFPNIKITIPMEEIIRNVENYYPLDKSKVYLGNLMDELVECSSLGEIKNVIEENIPEKHLMMRFKLLNIFESLFNENMINVSAPEAPAILEYEDKFGEKYINLSVQTIMMAGFIPSIQTSDLINHHFFSAYMSFIVNMIYKNQYENEYFKKRTVSLFVDEIDKMWRGNNGHLIKDALGLIGTNGRAARIGLRWCTQHYDKVPDQIKGNTKFLFISRKADSKEVNEIRKDFDIPKSMDTDILNLRSIPNEERFELVAVTTEKFILYDPITGLKTSTTTAQRGCLIPPMARHRVPGISI